MSTPTDKSWTKNFDGEGAGRGWVVTDEKGRRIHQMSSRDGDEERIANLIVAAPDLLRAAELQVEAERLERRLPKSANYLEKAQVREKYFEAEDARKTALAKARG